MLFDKNTIDLLKSVVKKEGWLNLPANGDSMFPFIQKGDICRFEACEPWELKKGDIALFSSESGYLVAHRFYYVKKLHNTEYYFFKGDTNLGFDQPVQREQIIGKLLYVQKRNKQIHIEDIRAYVWGKFILIAPILSGILRHFLNSKKRYEPL